MATKRKGDRCWGRGECQAPVGWRAPEEHQGALYDRDTEMVCGWQVFGRGPSAGARIEWEYGGRMRCDVSMCPNTPGVAVVETNARHLRIPVDVLVAVEVRAQSR